MENFGHSKRTLQIKCMICILESFLFYLQTIQLLCWQSETIVSPLNYIPIFSIIITLNTIIILRINLTLSKFFFHAHQILKFWRCCNLWHWSLIIRDQTTSWRIQINVYSPWIINTLLIFQSWIWIIILKLLNFMLNNHLPLDFFS